MKLQYDFVVIDSDQVNCFISCKAIMQAVRATVIQTFTAPTDGMNYILKRHSAKTGNRLILFINMDHPEMSNWEFVEEFQKLNTEIKENTRLFILTSSVDHNDRTYAAKYNFIKGFFVKPLSSENVSLCLSADRNKN